MAITLYPDFPQAPDFDALRQQRLDHERMFLEPDDYVANLPAEQKQAMDAWLSWSPDPKGDVRKLTAKGFVGEVYGLPDEALENGGYEAHRERYARDVLKVPAPLAVDDEMFFGLVKGEQEKARNRRYLITGKDGEDDASRAINERSLQRWATRAALAGEAPVAAFAAWKESAKPEGEEDFFPIWQEQFSQVAARAEPYRKALDEAFSILRKGMGAEEGETSVFGGVIDAASPLAGMSEADFRTVGIPALRAMAELAAGTDKGKLQQALESFRRPIDNAAGASFDLLDWFGQSFSAGFAGTQSMDQGDLQRTKKTLLRAVADQAIDPVRVLATSSVGKIAEQMLYDTSGSLGYMATAAIPGGIGVAASLAGYQDSNKAQLLMRYPGMSVNDAGAIAAAAAPIQTALDRLSLKVISGQMPVLSSVIQRAGAPGGNAVMRFALYGAGAVATEYTAEKLQDAAPLAMQEALAAIKTDVPDADWSDLEALDARTFFAVLPLALIGAGVNAVRDNATAKSLLQDSQALEAFGLSGEQITAIQESPQPMAALQEAWKERQVPADAAARWQEYSASIDAGTASLAEAMESNEITFERGANTAGEPAYRVTKQGVATDHTSAPAALAVIQQHMGRADQEANGPLLEMLAELDANPLSPVREGSVTLTEGQTVAQYQAERASLIQDETAEPQARARAERESAAMVRRQQVFEEQFPDKPIDWRAVAVGGQSELEVKDGVARAVLRVANGESAYTPLEEKTEVEAEAWVRSGETTWQNLEGMIRQVEKATGDTYINGHTAGVDAARDQLAIKEAYSELAQVHATGKGRAGAAADSGIAEVARMDRKAARLNLRQAISTGKMAESLVKRLKAHVEWLKAVVSKAVRLNRARREAGGKFDLDAFLDKSVGIGTEEQHAAAVTAEAGRIFEGESAPSFRLSAVDAEYMAAVETGDMEAAAAMVESAAAAAGYRHKHFHQTSEAARGAIFREGFRLDKGRARLNDEQVPDAFFFKADPKNIGVGDADAPVQMPVFLKYENPLVLRDRDDVRRWMDSNREYVATVRELKENDRAQAAAFDAKWEEMRVADVAGDEETAARIDAETDALLPAWEAKNAEIAARARAIITAELKAAGHDAIAIRNDAGSFNRSVSTTAVFNPNQIKSAEAVTRDENGEIIPLSQRFNPSKNSISYRLTPVATLDALAEQMAKRTRDPDARRKVYDQMSKALETLRRNWTEMRVTWNGEARAVAEKKSPRELNKEQAFREAAAYADAEQKIMESLSRYAQSALGMTGEDTSAFAGPLAQRFTGGRFGTSGRIQSRADAIRFAADADFSLGGEMDGAAGLPSMFFGGALSADNAAQEAYEAGEISDPSPDTLWEALRKELRTQARNKEAMKAALSTLKEAQKQARRAAKEEAANWRADQDEMQEKDWDARAVMLRHLRTLDAILSALPPEVRAKVGGWTSIASLKTQPAMQKELELRLKMADEHLENFLKKDALDQIRALIEKAKPDREPGKKSKGKLGAAVHRFFDEVERVSELTPVQVQEETVLLESGFLREDLEDTEAAAIFEKQQILDMFGALGKPTAHDAAHLTRALDMLEQVYVEGRNRWRLIEEARLADVAALAQQVADTLGGPSYTGSQKQKKDAAGVKSKATKWNLDMRSFPEIMSMLLGEGNPLAVRWSRAAREAFAQKNDDIRALRRRWNDALEKATGKKGIKARRVLWEMGNPKNQKVTVTTAGPGGSETQMIPIPLIDDWAAGNGDPEAVGVSSVEASELIDARVAMEDSDTRQSLPLAKAKRGASETVAMTESEAVFLSMLGRQDQYLAALDKAGWDTESLLQIEDQLSSAAKSLREFLAKEYQEGYAPLAQVFERMFGVGLPQIKNYAPAAFYNVGTEQLMDPTGSGAIEGGFRAGFLKNRKTHQAAPKLENAFATFFGHANQTAHWKAMAETVRELSGVFGRPEVKRAIESAHGKEMAASVQQWIKALEGNGLQVQSGIMDSFVRLVTSQQSYIALAWKVGTLFKQSSAALGAAYKMPAAAYLKGFARLMSGKLDGKAMFNSPVIQRRLETGFAPEVRAAMNDIWNAKPSLRQSFLEKGMELIGLTDAFFTTASAAIAYDYHLQEAKKAGMGEAEAQTAAMTEVEAIVAATAQPAEVADRSLFELRQGAFGKLAFLFASEARQKASLWLTAWSNTLSGKGTRSDARVLILAHLIVGPMMQAITSAVWDGRDDDDDELFDAQHWDPMDFFKATVAGPLAGLPLIGELVSGFEKTGVLGRFKTAVEAAKKLFSGAPDSEDETAEWYFRRIVQVLQGADAFSGTAAGAAGQVFGFIDNAVDTDEEKAAKEKAAIRRAKREERAAREGL